MNVILREHVEKLGRRGDVVKVAPGYARNFLLPRNLALPATDANRKVVERERQKAEAREATERATAEALAARLAAVDIVLARRVGDTGQLYGSVTAADLAEALQARGIEVERRKIQLDEPLKELGEFTVAVKLARDVAGQIKVTVAKEE